jgi:UDP-N-acetyl-D-mannosaminuronate dehydrogenase
MPEYAVRRLEEEYGDLAGAKVAVLGASYRGGVKETAFSGVFPVVDALRERGASVLVHDPMFSDDELARFGWEPYHLGEPVDAVIIQADHQEYDRLAGLAVPGAKVVLNGRGSLSSPNNGRRIGDGH